VDQDSYGEVGQPWSGSYDHVYCVDVFMVRGECSLQCGLFNVEEINECVYD
jgi:hypothetical protein